MLEPSRHTETGIKKDSKEQNSMRGRDIVLCAIIIQALKPKFGIFQMPVDFLHWLEAPSFLDEMRYGFENRSG
jgi:hypothetical protein